MEFLKAGIQYVLDLGAAGMMPVILTIFGLVLGQGFKKSFRAGLTVGIGFIGVNLVIGLLTSSVGAAAQQMVSNMGLDLDIIDVGWPVGAAISWASPFAMVLIPGVFILNMVMISLNLTKTIDVDIWNYWQFIFAGAMIYYATNNAVIAVVCALVYAAIAFKLADWTAPAVEHYLGLPGVSLPHVETVNMAPFTYALNKIEDKIPGFNKLEVTGDNLRDKIGMLGEPMMIGIMLGIGIGCLAGYDSKAVINLGMQMGAVMVVLPKMVALLMEGLMPISEGARAFVQKKFPGKDVYIGLDAAVGTGQPAVLTTAVILMPIALFLAFVLPYNKMLPFADLSGLPFMVIWTVIACRGNLARTILNATILLCLVFFIATNLAPFTTEIGNAAGFDFPEGATMISGIAISCHAIVWMMINLIAPSSPTQFAIGVVAVVLYVLAWLWVKNDIKKQYGLLPSQQEESKASSSSGS